MRRTELDLCRICACIMVIVIHTVAVEWYSDPSAFSWRIYNLADTMARSAVPLFFMISGALLLSRENLDVKRLVTKNIPHLVFLYFAWGGLYAVYEHVVLGKYSSVHELVPATVKGYYHLWYLPAMVMIYFALPIVWGAIHGKKISAGYILAYLLVIVTVKETVSVIHGLPDIIKALANLIDFSKLGFMVYVLWGYWLSKRKYGVRTRILAPVLFMLTAGVTAWLNRQYSLELGEANTWLYGTLLLPTFLMGTMIFCFFLSFRDVEFSHAGIIEKLSACTLGIYLIHPMFLKLLKKLGITVAMCSPVISVPLFVAGIFLACLFVVWLLHKIPVVRKLV